jgi:hypothetical protein
VNKDRLVSIRVAAESTGIAERTLRYWIQSGKLTATAGKRGKLVRLADVEAIATATGRHPASEDPAGNFADGNSGNTAEVPTTDQTRQNLEAIRDEGLQPLVDQIRDLERDRGRLEVERDHARQEAAELRQRLEGMESHQDNENSENEGKVAGNVEDTAQPPAKPSIWQRIRAIYTSTSAGIRNFQSTIVAIIYLITGTLSLWNFFGNLGAEPTFPVETPGEPGENGPVSPPEPIPVPDPPDPVDQFVVMPLTITVILFGFLLLSRSVRHWVSQRRWRKVVIVAAPSLWIITAVFFS